MASTEELTTSRTWFKCYGPSAQEEQQIRNALALIDEKIEFNWRWRRTAQRCRRQARIEIYREMEETNINCINHALRDLFQIRKALKKGRAR